MTDPNPATDPIDRTPTTSRHSSVASRRMPHFIQAKVAHPGIPDTHVPRSALRSLLSNRDYKVTLVSAPAGTGKTTLLADWSASDLDGRAAWVSIDHGDDDPVRFWMYVIASLEIHEPQLGIDATDLLCEKNGFDPLEVIESLVADCEHLEKPLPLILDDLHNLAAPTVYRQLAGFIERCPPQLPVVLSTRTDPLLSINRLRASQDLMELRQTDLRFTPQEAEKFFEGQLPSVNRDELSLLVARTEGWVIALQMVAVSLRESKNLRQYLDRMASLDSNISDYLIEEIMESLSPDIRDFVLYTSILSELDPDVCNAVTHRQDSRRILAQLRKQNLFVVSPDRSRPAWRYHHLFAELLRVELRAENPAEERLAHANAADCYASRGNFPAAIDHLLAAERYEGAADLLVAHLASFFDAGLQLSLMKWIDRFPPNFFEGSSKRMLDLVAVMGANGRYAEAADWLKRYDSESDLEEKDPVQEARYDVLKALLFYFEGDPASAIEWSERAIASYRPAADDGYHSRLPFVMIRCRGWLGDTRAALAASVREYPVPLLPPAFQRALMAAALSYICALEGNLREAEALSLTALPRDEGPHPPGLVDAHLARGEVYWERDEWEAAEREFEQALRESEQRPLVPHALLASLGLARIWHACGHREEAFSLIASTRHLNLGRPLGAPFSALINRTAVELFLDEGRLAEVWEFLEQIPWSPDTALLTARALLMEERTTDAQDILLPLGKEGLTPRQRMEHAILELKIGAPTHQPSFARALSFAASEGFARRLRVEGIVPESLDDLINKGPIVKPTEPSGEPDGSSTTSSSLQLGDTPSVSSGEARVLERLPQWLSNKEIADELFISVNTVKTHLKSIYRKLNATSRSDAIAQARKLGLLRT
jgi:LuxR family transcriptional regulator, maltose regulon positive regulatory protein